MIKSLRTILSIASFTMMSFLLISCTLQPNWYAAGRWNYAHQHYMQALPQLLWAAQLGNPDAQYAVGFMYYNGMATPKDDVLAYHWFQKSAKQGNQRAMFALNQMEGLTLQSEKNALVAAKKTGTAKHTVPMAHHHAIHHHTQMPILPTPTVSSAKAVAAKAKPTLKLPALPAPIKT